jgi:nucleotide-binding universal stress UspA family protein
MAERTQNRLSSHEAARHAPDGFHSLLIPVDLSPVSDRVLGRVALLPLAEGARLTLLHSVPQNLQRRAQRRAERDARRALDGEAKSLARTLPKSVAIEHVVMVGAPAAEIAKCASSAKAELIVMGRGGSRAFRDVFLGSTAERVIRKGQLPVLVVRLPPRTPYRRPALALDLDQAAHEALALLLRVIPPPRPRAAVIHAYDAPFQGLIYPSLSIDEAEEYRDQFRQKATRELAKILGTGLAQAGASPNDTPPWKILVRYGAPRTIIDKTVKKAETDLLVLGTHGYSGVTHAFLGTVAGDVLRGVTCDVLVVPPRQDTTSSI